MDYLRVETIPTLRDPVLVMAFAGWNDAAQVASTAVRHLVDTWGARRFAEIDPEEFFDFSETRPTVHLLDNLHRRIEWPGNEFFYRRSQGKEPDLVLLLGNEPQLRWRTFTRQVVDLGQQCAVSKVIALGGLIADTLHSRPARLSGSSTDSRMRQKLLAMGVEMSRYEGPTGIVGVLQDSFRQSGVAAGSLWGNVPHYISATANPKITLALLERLDSLLNLHLDLQSLELDARRFTRQVDEAIARNPEIAEYVRQLETQADEEDEDDETGLVEEDVPPLPSGESVVAELEEFFRRRQTGSEEG